MASGAGRSVVMIGTISFLPLSIPSQSPLVMAMMDWGFYHYSIQVADSGVHEEWPGSALLMWGEAALIWFASW